MSEHSKIEWTTGTWSPILGCSKVSPGCMNCYAVAHVHRMAGNPNPKIRDANAGLTDRHRNGQLDWTGAVRLLPDRLDLPFHWKKPRRVFVNSLSDLFHEGLTDEEIARVWVVMLLTPHVTYQVLTKRPERAASLLRDPAFYGLVLVASREWRYRHPETLHVPVSSPARMPGRHIWLGTSVEDQGAADERIPHLLATPAAIRFLSCEPLIESINLRPWLWHRPETSDGPTRAVSWCIIGGESGSGARRCGLGWISGLIDQCQAAFVPTFVKQVGAVLAGEMHLKDRKGGDESEWPDWLHVRQYPDEAAS